MEAPASQWAIVLCGSVGGVFLQSASACRVARGAARAAGEPVFGVKRLASKTGRLIRADLGAAGILMDSPEGRADFHSLRHTYVTWLEGSGAGIKTRMELARHASPELTLGRYSHAQPALVRSAVDTLDQQGISSAHPGAHTHEREQAVGVGVQAGNRSADRTTDRSAEESPKDRLSLGQTLDGREAGGSGAGGIRTHETVTRLRDFQSRSFSHSDTAPGQGGRQTKAFQSSVANRLSGRLS